MHKGIGYLDKRTRLFQSNRIFKLIVEPWKMYCVSQSVTHAPNYNYNYNLSKISYKLTNRIRPKFTLLSSHLCLFTIFNMHMHAFRWFRIVFGINNNYMYYYCIEISIVSSNNQQIFAYVFWQQSARMRCTQTITLFMLLPCKKFIATNNVQPNRLYTHQLTPFRLSGH